MKYLVFIFLISVIGSNTIIDSRDNRAYSIIDVAGKTWIKENLKYVPIDSSASNATVIKIPEHYEEYGAYYTLRAAKTACPEGFRLVYMKDFKSLLKAMKGSENELQGKVVSSDELSKYGFKLGGFVKKQQLGWTDRIGFYWTSSDTLKTYYKEPDKGLQKHLIGIHIYNKKGTDSFNIEPTYMLAKDYAPNTALNCKCVKDSKN